MATIKFDKRGMPDMWTERQSTLTDNCIKKIADEVIKRLNDKDDIVKCKDCKARGWYAQCEGMMDYDFCSRGERAE